MFNSLVDLVTTSDWPYVIVFAIAALDAVFPVVPSEATVITAAALAASGRLSLAAVAFAAATGAAVGDNGGYVLGRVSSRYVRRLLQSPRARERLEWAEEKLEQRGSTVIVVSRFIPGGRTATMLAAGIIHFRWPRFARLDAVAAVLWATYSCALGIVGGRTFEDEPLYAVLLALALALVLAVLIELGRRYRQRRRPASR
jgi:membrane protein DedA with SNARE-associated domain